MYPLIWYQQCVQLQECGFELWMRSVDMLIEASAPGMRAAKECYLQRMQWWRDFERMFQ